MKTDPLRVLITGAASGIGRETARRLAARGARLVIVDRDVAGLGLLRSELQKTGAEAHPVAVDLSDLDALPRVVETAVASLGGLDVLVNNAGLLSFKPFESESTSGLETLQRVNVLAPMVLTRSALPYMKAQGHGRIVNVGSIFGSIGFAWFASYSSSKFAIRGFSEALRRELRGTGVQVTYIAPRATRTRLADLFGRMAEATKMHLDDPERVAARIVKAIERQSRDVYVGFPECLFVRINGLLPRFVDKALAGNDAKARPFAEEAAQVTARVEVTADVAATRTRSVA